MVQTAKVTRVLSDGRAEVAVKRQSACGHDCSKCGGGCSELMVSSTVAVIAANPVRAMPGDMVTVDGRVVGRHDGLMYYTPGQRRGLGIGGGGNGERWFVVDKDLAHNRLIVEQGEESGRLLSRSAEADDAHWVLGEPPAAPGASVHLMARFRHRQALQGVTVTVLDPKTIHIDFDEHQRAITPGQAVVLYDGDECLGGATSDSDDRIVQ